MLRTAIVLLLAVATFREGPYVVERVSDGDTIAIRRGNRRVLVRLIGVDAPEVDGPYRRREKGGDLAKREMEKLVAGRKVHIQGDPHQPLFDTHGRMLAYVYEGRTLVNGEMIRRGYARAYRKFRHEQRETFIRYENEARTGKRGLWKHGSP
jgi:micrococcal nuclease